MSITYESVEPMVEEIYKHIGIDRPENHENIVEFVRNDIEETADPDEWHSGDVAIAFRRFLESNSNN